MLQKFHIKDLFCLQNLGAKNAFNPRSPNARISHYTAVNEFCVNRETSRLVINEEWNRFSGFSNCQRSCYEENLIS